MMIRMLLVTGACLALLAGCSAASRPAAPHHYALVGPAHASAAAATGTRAGPTLRVARIVAPAWFEGTNLYYRLDYRDRNQVTAYSASDWVAPPMRMLEQLIQNTLFSSGHWAAVVGPSSPADVGYSVHVRLDDFSQVFSSPEQSDAVLDATATLIAHADDKTLAQRHFHVQVPAATADAAGGVAALDTASRQFAASLQEWVGAHVQGSRTTR